MSRRLSSGGESDGSEDGSQNEGRVLRARQPPKIHADAGEGHSHHKRQKSAGEAASENAPKRQKVVEIDSEEDTAEPPESTSGPSTPQPSNPPRRIEREFALVKGTPVEAFHPDDGFWYPSRIVGVRSERQEVKIHYLGYNKRQDKWHPMGSQLLRAPKPPTRAATAELVIPHAMQVPKTMIKALNLDTDTPPPRTKMAAHMAPPPPAGSLSAPTHHRIPVFTRIRSDTGTQESETDGDHTDEHSGRKTRSGRLLPSEGEIISPAPPSLRRVHKQTASEVSEGDDGNQPTCRPRHRPPRRSNEKSQSEVSEAEQNVSPAPPNLRQIKKPVSEVSEGEQQQPSPAPGALRRGLKSQCDVSEGEQVGLESDGPVRRTRTMMREVKAESEASLPVDESGEHEESFEGAQQQQQPSPAPAGLKRGHKSQSETSEGEQVGSESDGPGRRRRTRPRTVTRELMTSPPAVESAQNEDGSDEDKKPLRLWPHTHTTSIKSENASGDTTEDDSLLIPVMPQAQISELESAEKRAAEKEMASENESFYSAGGDPMEDESREEEEETKEVEVRRLRGGRIIPLAESGEEGDQKDEGMKEEELIEGRELTQEEIEMMQKIEERKARARDRERQRAALKAAKKERDRLRYWKKKMEVEEEKRRREELGIVETKGPKKVKKELEKLVLSDFEEISGDDSDSRLTRRKRKKKKGEENSTTETENDGEKSAPRLGHRGPWRNGKEGDTTEDDDVMVYRVTGTGQGSKRLHSAPTMSGISSTESPAAPGGVQINRRLGVPWSAVKEMRFLPPSHMPSGDGQPIVQELTSDEPAILHRPKRTGMGEEAKNALFVNAPLRYQPAISLETAAIVLTAQGVTAPPIKAPQAHRQPSVEKEKNPKVEKEIHPVFFCKHESCGQGFITLAGLQSHYRSKHPTPRPPPPPRGERAEGEEWSSEGEEGDTQSDRPKLRARCPMSAPPTVQRGDGKPASSPQRPLRSNTAIVCDQITPTTFKGMEVIKDPLSRQSLGDPKSLTRLSPAAPGGTPGQTPRPGGMRQLPQFSHHSAQTEPKKSHRAVVNPIRPPPTRQLPRRGASGEMLPPAPETATKVPEVAAVGAAPAVDGGEGEDSGREKRNASVEAMKRLAQPKLVRQQRVFARWEGDGIFYPATITSVHPDGTYAVRFDDGFSGTKTLLDIIVAQPKDGPKRKGERKEKKKPLYDPELLSDDEPGQIWCVCGTSANYGHMIQCEKCDVWQHYQCVGIDEANVPDEFVCGECQDFRYCRDSREVLLSTTIPTLAQRSKNPPREKELRFVQSQMAKDVSAMKAILRAAALKLAGPPKVPVRSQSQSSIAIATGSSQPITSQGASLPGTAAKPQIPLSTGSAQHTPTPTRTPTPTPTPPPHMATPTTTLNPQGNLFFPPRPPTHTPAHEQQHLLHQKMYGFLPPNTTYPPTNTTPRATPPPASHPQTQTPTQNSDGNPPVSQITNTKTEPASTDTKAGKEETPKTEAVVNGVIEGGSNPAVKISAAEVDEIEASQKELERHIAFLEAQLHELGKSRPDYQSLLKAYQSV